MWGAKKKIRPLKHKNTKLHEKRSNYWLTVRMILKVNADNERINRLINKNHRSINEALN